jgi:DNA-binding CsgD family transcriptional regulator
MNSHRPTETHVYAARNRAYTSTYNAAPLAVRPAPVQKIEFTKPYVAKAHGSDRVSSVQPLQLLPDVDHLRNSSQGFLLTDVTFKPLYGNEAATSILNFRDELQPGATRAVVAQRIRTILQAERFSRGLPAVEFVSGKRLYVCRPFLLESRDRPARRPPMVILLLERRARDPLPLSEMSRQFHLSPRECETVRYLSQGLTTKEVAQHMGVSPNTVKQFVRLIMSKMGVTTRSGIVGKLVAG